MNLALNPFILRPHSVAIGKWRVPLISKLNPSSASAALDFHARFLDFPDYLPDLNPPAEQGKKLDPSSTSAAVDVRSRLMMRTADHRSSSVFWRLAGSGKEKGTELVEYITVHVCSLMNCRINICGEVLERRPMYQSVRFVVLFRAGNCVEPIFSGDIF